MSSTADRFARALRAVHARMRFPLQCITVALLFAGLTVIGAIGAGGGLAHATLGQADILPTKPANPTNYPTLEALLRQSPHDTVVVLKHVEDDQKNSLLPEARERFDNFVRFMAFVDSQNVRVVALARIAPGQTLIAPKHALPTEVHAAMRNVTPLYAGFPWTGAPETAYLTAAIQGTTFLDAHLQGVRNIILIGHGLDESVELPMFEAVFNRVNVYRNPLLDPRVTERVDPTYHTRYVDRMDRLPRSPNAAPLKLPTTLAEDPHLHYVPIGNIPGVLSTLPNANFEGTSSFGPDGRPVPHVFAPGTPPRYSMGDFANVQAYDAQLRLVLTGVVEDQATIEHHTNPDRSALVVVPDNVVNRFAATTAWMNDAQMRQAVIDQGISAFSHGVPFPDQRGEQALHTGLVELTVSAHGGVHPNGGYTVGNLHPGQLAALIATHPELDIAPVIARGQMPRITHLHLLACGVRCQADYEAGSAGNLGQDEVDYAQALVRALRRNGIHVDHVSVHNATVVTFQGGPENISAWFVLSDAFGDPRGWAYESRLLTTTLEYDSAGDTFFENLDLNELQRIQVEGVRPLPLVRHAGGPLVPAAPGRTPAWIAQATGPAIAAPGLAHVTAAGAVVNVTPAPGLAPRLDPGSRRGGDWWPVMEVMFKNGTVVTTADLDAFMAGARPDDGHVVVVDTDPARLEGVRLALHLARTAPNAIAWIAQLRANGLDTAGPDLIDIWRGTTPHDHNTELGLLSDQHVEAAFQILRQRVVAGEFVFHGADITTRDGAGVVNASLGHEPVAMLWLPDDDQFLARSALLGSDRGRVETLLQLRLNVALLMGPDTVVWQEQPGGGAWHVAGEQAYRNHFQLPGRQPLPDAANTGGGAATAGGRDQAVIAGVDAGLVRDGASSTDRDAVRDALHDREQGRLHSWWTRAREALGNVADWVMHRFAAMMRSMGLWDAPAAILPAEAAAAHAQDPVIVRMQAQSLGTRLLRASRDLLVAHALDPHTWVPVLETARALTTACPMSGCTAREAETEYEMRWLHETTGEERIVRTRDPVFAQTRDFLAMHVVQANADIAGGHVSSMNAAFALMGLAHILQANKQSQQEGLPSNLATSLQVQMYLGEAMAVAGVAKDVVQVVQLAREGMREAAEVSSALGQTVRIEARLLRTLGTTLDVVGGLASVGLVGVDIYNLANAKTDMQRAVAGAQLGVDSMSVGVTAAAIVAEMAGAATASSIIGAFAVPLAGIGIGVVGLVEAFMAVAADVDASAAKFDKFADLYARTSWSSAEDGLVASGHPSAPTKRSAYKWDAKSQTLQPVHGIAIGRVDLRARDSLGRRSTAFAESYIDRADPTKQGSQSVAGSRPTLTGGNVPSPDPNAAPIPILARTGIYPTGHLPLATADVVETLVVPATPASRFHSYEYQNLADANDRHRQEAGFMGYEVLRRLESTDWNAGFFLYDFDLNAVGTILRRVHENWIPTTVDLVLDDAVHTVAWPEFIIPKDTTWTPEQQQTYRASNRQMTGNMRYRVSPSGRTQAYVLALQDGYGSIELQAAGTGKSTTWMLDARHLANPDGIATSLESRPSGPGQHGVLRISGNEVRIAGVTGATPVAGEGSAQVYVVMAHGVWHVDFAKGELVSKDLLAATDLVHDKRVQDALRRKGFSWRSDGFIELTGSPTRPFPVHGATVQRYYQSVRDETLVHALEDAYPKATLVFGDAHEALFHDPDSGQLLRVAAGSVRPHRAFVIGAANDTTPHVIKRVDRLNADTLLVLVEYKRKTPAYLTGTAAPEINDGVTIAYKIGAEQAQVFALMGHHRLSAHLEESDRATPNGEAYGDFMAYLATLANVAYTPTPVAGLTPLVPVPAQWVSVNGMVRVPTGDVARQYWIRASDGHLLKPLFVAPSATCRAGIGAVDGFKVRHAVTSAGCALAHPGDAVMLDAYQGPAAETGSATTTWHRFHTPSLGVLYGVRAHAPETSPVQYPRTQLLAVGKAGAAIIEGEDASGLVWRQADTGWQLSGVAAAYVIAAPNAWLTNLTALVASQPQATPAASPLPVSGVQDASNQDVQAWYMPAEDRWTLGKPGMHVVDDGTRSPFRATLRDADGALWHSSTMTGGQFAAMLDGRKLRGDVQLESVKLPAGFGRPVSLSARRDAQCDGTFAMYENGTAMCLSATGRPQVLEMAWCPAQPVPARPAGTQADYVQLACANGSTRDRSGWLAPSGERIALPKPDALLDASQYRLLGFSAQAKEAYFFHPEHQILYVTNWAGDLQRRHWMADANVVGDSLFLHQARNGLPAAYIPRIDGLTTLGLASASHYAADYLIDAATRTHYPRIVVDMGAAPAGPHQTHDVHLLFDNASKLVVQAWPGGWRAHNEDTGQQIELRGSGGNKALHFGDTGQSLELADLRPVSFLELPKDFVLPPANAPFTDRLDVDGDNLADLAWVENVNGQGRLRWVSRNADGTRAGVDVRSDVAVPWTSDVAQYRWLSSEGTALYCAWVQAASPVVGRTGLNCYAIDRDGVRPAGRQAANAGSAPPANLEAAITATANAARYLQLQREPGQSLGELVRFDGTDFQCVRDGNNTNACLRTDSLAAAKADQTFLTCPATTTTAQAPAWCQRARHAQVQATVIGPWTPSGFMVRLNQGDVECMSYDGRNCIGAATPDFTRVAKPLVCGAAHRIQWGSPGYGNPAHWCESRRAAAGDITAVPPPTAGSAPSVSNLRIDGDLRIGNTLRTLYDFAHAGGAKEGASQYQWSITDAAGQWRPINGAKHRTYTLRPEDLGSTRSLRFTIERLVASTGDVAATQWSTQRTGIQGNPPEARNLRIEGQAMHGHSLRAAFDPYDAEGDPIGGTTYQWCEYPADSETANSCTAWSTSDTYAITLANIGKRIAVKVIVRTTSGTPNVGVETLSAKTAVVTGAPPEARNLRIEGHAQQGAVLRAVFDAYDAQNDPFGGTTYQWCEYPATGDTPNSCAAWSTSDSWTVTAGNVGKRLAVKVIPRTSSGTPNVGEEVIAEKTGVIVGGNAPRALNLRIEGEAKLGARLQALFTGFDVKGDPIGGSTYRWCEYAPNAATPTGCTEWSTSPYYTVAAANVGKQLAVKVIVRTTSGAPSAGAEATSPEKTATVVWASPSHAREGVVAIPDSGAWVESKITVYDYGTITDHRVNVRITHPNIGDLQVNLVNPQGVSYTLHNRSGGGDDNLIKEFKVPATGGEQRGVWTLRIRDAGTGFTGQLESWRMSFQGPAATVWPGPPPLEGTYHIRFALMQPPHPWSDYGCLVANGNGTTQVLSAMSAPPEKRVMCNATVESGIARWDVYPVVSSTGQIAHVIKNRSNNKCLIRSSNGTALHATLFLWSTSNQKFCGFPTADVLIANGQAAWDLSGLQPVGQDSRAFHTGGIRLMKPTQSFLVLTPALEPTPTARFSNDVEVIKQWEMEFHRVGDLPGASPPEARNVRIEGTVEPRETLSAVFDAFDANGDTFGGTTYQWCTYAANSDTPEGCSDWSTDAHLLVNVEHINKRLAVKVIPRTTTGMPNQGVQVESAKTIVVPKPPRIYEREDFSLWLAIPDNGSTDSAIHVFEDEPTTAVVLKVNIAHARTSDLQVTLTSPQGTTWTVPATHFQGQEYTIALTSSQQRGNWILQIRDKQPGVAGQLDYWSMEFR